MGQVIIQDDTTKNPLELIGREAGCCWGASTSDPEKNIKRAKDCIESGHGRVMEYPQVYMILDGYSARVIREFYTHIGGASTRLQSSTRYIKYESGFDYVIPHTIENKPEASHIYEATMNLILGGMRSLEELGVPREDCAMLLPLGMTTKVVCRMNLRTLIDMSHQRLCSRAFWEFRELFKDIMNGLKEYSEEWSWIVDNCFMPKCEVCGFCTEKKSCGRKPKKNS